MLGKLVGSTSLFRKLQSQVFRAATKRSPSSVITRCDLSSTAAPWTRKRKFTIKQKSASSSCTMSTTAVPVKEESTSSTTIDNTVVDDPCWGSPDKCSLGDLLQLISKAKTILYESPHYVVLDKPADLRMDGEYPATVHKLLTYWYPPPSLQEEVFAMAQQQQSLSSSSKQQEQQQQEDWLLGQLAKYHLHSDHPDNQLRPCHQLDYATSGVLVVARTKAAAARAVKCFEDRTTQKAYLAVLHGHVQISHTWPELEASVVDARLAALEDCFRRGRKKSHQGTFQGYQPPFALYQVWQQHALKRPRKKKSLLSDREWERVWDELNLHECNPPLDPKFGWKHVKKMKQTEPFVRAAKVYNKLVNPTTMQSAAEEKNNPKEQQHKFPLFFRVRGDEPESFYIAAPIAEADDDFAMRLPPGLADLVPPPLQVGSSELNYKPSLTKCTITKRGTLETKKVTKVRLVPRTGRRHQLRVHTSLAGHAIVGDHTYEPTNERALYNRMCLHSQMLKIPLEDGHEALEIEAPDPFHV